MTDKTGGPASEAFKAGRDCANNGANTTNCNFRYFLAKELTAEWQRGHDAVLAEEVASEDTPEVHSGDCTFFATGNGLPTDGICTCGYGLKVLASSEGDDVELISKERLAARDRGGW